MSNPKVSVPVAAKNRTHFDLSSQTITTQDFGRLDVGNVIEMVPGDKITSGTLKSFIRLAPMPVPTFARCHLKTRVIFVPNRLIFKGWESFISNRYALDFQGSKTPNIPSMKYNYVSQFLLGNDVRDNYVTQIMSSDYSKADLISKQSDGTLYGYKLTRGGKNIKTLLEGLGYGWCQYDLNSSDRWYSLLPLYAYHKAYFDWFRNPKYSADYSPLESLFDTVSTDDNAIIAARKDLFEPRFVSFESDIFNSAWESPTSSYSGGTLKGSNILQERYGKSSAGGQFPSYNEIDSSSSGTTPYINLEASRTLNATVIKGLTAIDEFLKRNNLSGHRYINQLLARFGVKVPDYRLQRSELVASFDTPFEMSAIFAQSAGTNGNSSTDLGDYAGLGMAGGSDTFSYEAQEHGFLLFLNYITYDPMYVQGVKPHCERLSLLDFFTPEFDNVGMRPLILDELYSRGDFTDGNMNPTSTFGFIPQYSDYKSGMFNDRLTGDFSTRSVNEGMDSYHLCRDFAPSDPFLKPTALVNNEAFAYLDPGFKTNNPDRIFRNSSWEDDHFYCYYNFDINISRPMASIGESLICGEHTHDVDMQYGGTQLG